MNLDLDINLNPDLVKLFKKLEESYTEEQIVHSIKENITPEKHSVLYIVPFEATEILEGRIDKISKSIDELLDKTFVDNVRVHELRKRYVESHDQYLCEKYHIMLSIIRGITVKNSRTCIDEDDKGMTCTVDKHLSVPVPVPVSVPVPTIVCVEDFDIEKTIYDGLYEARDEYLKLLDIMISVKQELNDLVTI